MKIRRGEGLAWFSEAILRGIGYLVNHVLEKLDEFRRQQGATYWGATYILECLLFARSNGYSSAVTHLLSGKALELHLRDYAVAVERLFLFLFDDLTWQDGLPVYVRELNLESPTGDTTIIEPNSGIISLSLELFGRVPEFLSYYREKDPARRDILSTILDASKEFDGAMPSDLGGPASVIGTVHFARLVQKLGKDSEFRKAVVQFERFLSRPLSPANGRGWYAMTWASGLLLASNKSITASRAEEIRSITIRLNERDRGATSQLRIPGQFGQRFQFNSDTDSDSFRTAIPIQIGQ